MARPYILSENNWKNIKDSHFEMAVLPWGATEAHNFHLPYGTDNIEGTAFAVQAARMAWEEGAKLIVLPTIPYGVNTGQTEHSSGYEYASEYTEIGPGRSYYCA